MALSTGRHTACDGSPMTVCGQGGILNDVAPQCEPRSIATPGHSCARGGTLTADECPVTVRSPARRPSASGRPVDPVLVPGCDGHVERPILAARGQRVM